MKDFSIIASFKTAFMQSPVSFFLALFFVIFLSAKEMVSAQTVTIGSQTWMAKNLEVVTFRNGDSIPEIKFDSFRRAVRQAFRKAGRKKQPVFGFDQSSAVNIDGESIGPSYGYKYNWYAVSDPRGLCPLGWHVPTQHDWKILTVYLDPTADTSKCCANIAGGMMKSSGNLSEGTGLWYSPNTAATNSSGFSGIPTFDDRGIWWTSEAHPWAPHGAKVAYLFNREASLGIGAMGRGFPVSIRCLKD